jgi:hypothetical protein
MIPVGYMAKRVVQRPDWLKTDTVADIYSVSGCVSEDFADYITYWKHNGYWFFDSAEVIKSVSNTEGIDLSDSTLFFYEVYEKQYDEDEKEWQCFGPETSFETHVVEPDRKHLEGYDVVSFYGGTSAECSPLSCNHMAQEIRVNEHCLFRKFDEAKLHLEKGDFKDCEPGPYRIFAVYTVDNGLKNQSSSPANDARRLF